MSKAVLLALMLGAAAASACSRPAGPTRKGGAGSGGAAADPNRPVARIGAQTITEAELVAETRGQLTKLEAEHAERVHGVRQQGLEALIEKRLIEAKAKAEGLTAEKLVEREVKVTDPPEAELQSIYDRTKASGRPLPPFPEVRGQIVEFVKQQRGEQVKREFVDKLKAASKVETLLPPLLPPKVEVAAEGPSKGDPKAPITIVEFSDFECPFCGKAEDAVKRVLAEYKGKVRLFYRDYPLPFHQKAQKASEAALCAGDQGKYWEMHERLFTNQSALEVAQLKDHAKSLGLDGGKFDKCLDAGDKAQLVVASKKAGDAAGVNGTPAFFINGRLLSGAQPFERFKEIIDAELASAGP